jgi:serine/threonine protein kinase/tetratricopeptide (TPR) repeat protein
LTVGADVPQGIGADDFHAVSELIPEPRRLNTREFLDAMVARGHFGRYVLLGVLGFGGMGAVLRAYDPRLDRQVALKVTLLPAVESESQWRQRNEQALLREAQSLARLAHPNVVTIYDVGKDDEQVYISMELVAGHNLNEWSKLKSRSAREILYALQQSARGLHAAHLAGIVHQDFKPLNVLYANDGRVLVVDFGLAALTQAAADRSAVPLQAAGREPSEFTVGGTPGYIAPELYLGHAPSRASDIFAFCVAAYELICGERPFRCDDVDDFLEHVEDGVRPAGKRWSRVPRRIADWLLRGLGATPNQRPASLIEFIEEVDELAQHRAASWVVACCALAMTGGAYLASTSEVEEPIGCSRLELEDRWQRIAAPAWDGRATEPSQDSLASIRLEASSLLHSSATQWREAWSEFCDTNRAMKTGSSIVSEKKARGSINLSETRHCLEKEWGTLEFLASIVDARSPTWTREQLLDMLDGIRVGARPQDCLRAGSKDSGTMLPADPHKQALVLASSARRVSLELEFKKSGADFAAAIEEGVIEAHEIGFVPNLIDWMLVRVQSEVENGLPQVARQHLLGSFLTAIAAGLDENSFRINEEKIRLTTAIIGERMDREETIAELESRYRRNAHGRSDRDLLLRARFLQAKVDLSARWTRDVNLASDICQAYRLRRQVLGEAHLLTLQTLRNCAQLEDEIGDRESALAHFQQIENRVVRTWGERHPLLLGIYYYRSQLEGADGHHERADEWLRRAIELGESIYGEGAVALLRYYRERALRLQQAGRLREAYGNFQSATHSAEQKLGYWSLESVAMRCFTAVLAFEIGRRESTEKVYSETFDYGRQMLSDVERLEPYVILYLGQLATLLGRLDDAALFLENREILQFQAHRGVFESEWAGWIYGDYFLAKHDYERASIYLSRALADLSPEEQGFPRHCRIVHSLAQTLIALGRPQQAKRHVEEALQVRQKMVGPRDIYVADFHAQLGQIAMNEGKWEMALNELTLALAANVPGERPPAFDEEWRELARQAKLRLGRSER